MSAESEIKIINNTDTGKVLNLLSKYSPHISLTVWCTIFSHLFIYLFTEH